MNTTTSRRAWTPRVGARVRIGRHRLFAVTPFRRGVVVRAETADGWVVRLDRPWQHVSTGEWLDEIAVLDQNLEPEERWLFRVWRRGVKSAVVLTVGVGLFASGLDGADAPWAWLALVVGPTLIGGAMFVLTRNLREVIAG